MKKRARRGYWRPLDVNAPYPFRTMTRGKFRGKLAHGYQGWYIRRGAIVTCVVVNSLGFWEIGLIDDAHLRIKLPRRFRGLRVQLVRGCWRVSASEGSIRTTPPLGFRVPGPRTAGVAFKEAKRLSWLASKIGIEAVTHRW